MTNPPVPATPLNVEACVRLLKLMLHVGDETMRGCLVNINVALSGDEFAQLRALASALPGMGKDSERLDALESWTKGDQTISFVLPEAEK